MSKCCESFELFVDPLALFYMFAFQWPVAILTASFSFCADGASDKSSHCGQEAQNVESASPGNPEIEDAEIKQKKDKKNREKEKKKGKSKIKEKKKKEENEDPEKKKKKGFGVMLRYGILQSKTTTHSCYKIGSNWCFHKVVENYFTWTQIMFMLLKKKAVYTFTPNL